MVSVSPPIPMFCGTLVGGVGEAQRPCSDEATAERRLCPRDPGFHGPLNAARPTAQAFVLAVALQCVTVLKKSVRICAERACG